MIAIFVGWGIRAGDEREESLAQVYREIEHPKLPNLKKTGLVIFITAWCSRRWCRFSRDDHPRRAAAAFLENLIGGLAMNLEGPFLLRLVFHGFVVVVGTLILAER